jgi:hypothetical protein
VEQTSRPTVFINAKTTTSPVPDYFMPPLEKLRELSRQSGKEYHRPRKGDFRQKIAGQQAGFNTFMN